jgi:hypothetical protein
METGVDINKATDGRKTNAGASISAITGLLVALGLLWGLDNIWWWPKMIETINLVGGALCAWGLTHKVMKWNRNRT